MLAPAGNDRFKSFMLSWPEKAITHLYECYYESLLIISQRYTHDLNASEDVVQAILTQLWRNHGKVAKRDPESIESYLVKRVKAESKTSGRRLERPTDQPNSGASKSVAEVMTLSRNSSDQDDITFLLDNIAVRGCKFDLEDNSYDGMRQVEHNIEWIRQGHARMVSMVKRLLIVIVVAVTSMSAICWFTTPIMSGTNDSRAGVYAFQVERLPDNSIITLRENSNYLFFHQPFYRWLNICGEARIQISKDRLRPFVIDLGKCQIRTLGANLLISATNGSNAAVQVTSGTISVVTENGTYKISSAQSVTILPNGALHRVEGSLYFHEWYSHYLQFSAASLSNVIKTLEEEYDVIIEMKDSFNNKEKFTGTFYHVNAVDEVLEVVCKTFSLHYKKSTRDSYVLTPDER